MNVTTPATNPAIKKIMSLIKGNFKVKKPIKEKKANKEKQLEKLFEKSAKQRLGGSMVYVSKSKVNWDLEEK